MLVPWPPLPRNRLHGLSLTPVPEVQSACPNLRLLRLCDQVDRLIIGGGMVFTFLKARGLSVGSSLVEEDKLDLVGYTASVACRQSTAHGAGRYCCSFVFMKDVLIRWLRRERGRKRRKPNLRQGRRRRPLWPIRSHDRASLVRARFLLDCSCA